MNDIYIRSPENRSLWFIRTIFIGGDSSETSRIFFWIKLIIIIIIIIMSTNTVYYWFQYVDG